MVGWREKDAADNGPDKWSRFQREAMPHLPDLYRTARWLTRDADKAEDLVQEVMFQALRSFHNFEAGTNCKAWLIKILFNQNARRLRRELRLQIVEDPDETIIQSAVYQPPLALALTDTEIIDALWKLRDIYRTAVILVDVEELSYKEAATVLDIPVGTVMSRISRGRDHLRQLLKGRSETRVDAVASRTAS